MKKIYKIYWMTKANQISDCDREQTKNLVVTDFFIFLNELIV